jgi:DNA-binding response OmpR family regulator
MCAGGVPVDTLPLIGRLVLVVEDEPLVAFEVEDNLRAAGAKIVAARHLEHALRLVDRADFSAAVLDFNLGRDTSASVCWRLVERQIPFMFHSGERHDEFLLWPTAPVLIKPSCAMMLVNMAARLLRRGEPSASAAVS